MKEGDLRSFIPSPKEFAAAFGVGSDPETLAPIDACGVILASVKALHQRARRRQSDLQELRAEFNEMKILYQGFGERSGAPEDGR